MVSGVSSLNVQDLQQNAIKLLEKISSLMHRASTGFGSHSTNQKYADFEKQVKLEADKVKNLELRMAIVAPMKAGKSTIINAIVGQEILPSRNSAMTMLPTEVVFQAELKEPVLTLSDQILEVFQDTLLALRSCEPMDKETQQEMNKYPHLAGLLRKIQARQELAFNKENIGRENIIDTLTELNDIIRLCNIIEPSCDPLGKLLEVPRVKTPFWRLATTNQSQMLGNLVIVDTPGPNEAGENLRLAAVVADQLKKAQWC